MRTADGVFVQVATSATPSDLDAALRERALRRQPPALDLRLRGAAPQLASPVRDALEALGRRGAMRPSPPPSRLLEIHFLSDLASHRAADDALARGGAVLRVHRESDVLLVHPIADPDDVHAVRATDLARRRLAASPAADHLAAHWEEHGADPLDDLPDEAALLASATILESIMGWLHGSRPDGPHILWCLEISTLRVTRHPVLRVPECEPPVLPGTPR